MFVEAWELPPPRPHTHVGGLLLCSDLVGPGCCFSFQAIKDNVIVHFDAEQAQLGAAAQHVLKELMVAMNSASDRLEPLAGGRLDATIWSDHWDGKMDMLKFFSDTLDTLKPGVMDNLNKTLRKVAWIIRLCCLSQPRNT